jgi:CDP-diacylglycerol pyrophosphatase
MTDDRLMVAEAVMAGQIPEYHLTQEEIDELFEIVCDAATDKLMAEAEQRGCSVFDGIEGNSLQ